MESDYDVCENCRLAFSQPLPFYSVETAADTLVDIRSRTQLLQSSCPMCVQIRTLLERGGPAANANSSMTATDEVELLFQHDPAVTDATLADTPRPSLRISSPQVPGPGGVAHLSLAADDGTPAASFIPHRPQPCSLDEVLTVVDGWIAHCDATHYQCRPRAFSQPARLLDVADPARVVLVETSLATAPLPYVALSYCWGAPPAAGTQHVQTTRANLASHRARGIPVAELPRTIGEAARVVRALRCRHLWVDALCIVQDDDDDRGRELARMGTIYADAYFTLSAAAATHSAHGFLRDDVPGGKPPAWFRMPYWPAETGSGGGRDHPVVVKVAPLGSRLPVAGAAPSSSGPLAVDPLHTRGWTFQETLLSRRLLLWSSVQPYWRCRVDAEAPLAITASLPSGASYLAASGIADALRFEALRSADPSTGNFLWSWLLVVEDYSRRRFTFARDRCDALAGIRDHHTAISHKGGYALGCFATSAHEDLMWKSLRPSGGGGRGARKLAEFPSWTWMSFDGEVRYPHIEWDATDFERADGFECTDWPLVDDLGNPVGGGSDATWLDQSQLDDDTEWVDLLEDLYSPGDPAPTRSRNMKLRGKVKEVAIHFDPVGERLQEADCYRVEGMRDETTLGEAAEKIGEITFDEWTSSGRQAQSSSGGKLIKRLECLLVGIAGPGVSKRFRRKGVRAADPESLDGHTAFGLVVAPVATSPVVYRRVGLFHGSPTSSRYFDTGPQKEYTLD